MLISNRSLFENKLLAVQNLLRIAVFYIDPEWFSCTMVSLIPDERRVSSQVKFDSNQGPCNWLHIGFKLKAREFVDLVKNGLAHFREVDDLTDLLSIHIVEVMPLKLGLLLYLSSYIFHVCHLCELSQWCHGAPKTFFDHLAHV